MFEARAERPFSDVSRVEADALITLSGRPVEGQRSLCLSRALADDVDDAAECLRAVERACGAAHDLDALNVIHVDALQLVVVHRLARVLRADAPAVDEDERLVRVHAADGRAVADHRVLLYVDADSEFQRLRECLCAHLVDVCARDDLDGTRRLLHLLLCAGCRDNNLIRMDPRGGRVLRALHRVGGDGQRTEYGGGQKNFLLHVFVEHLSISYHCMSNVACTKTPRGKFWRVAADASFCSPKDISSVLARPPFTAASGT